LLSSVMCCHVVVWMSTDGSEKPVISQLLWRWNASWCISSTASHPRKSLNLFHLTILEGVA
jgi:hypothetical protein